MEVTLLGDIHGETRKLRIKEDKLTIQIGDFGFADTYKILDTISPENLLILGGNHDEYPALITYPHYLGDYGIIPGTKSTFFCRGALSIDKEVRTIGVNWWREEELTLSEGIKMIELYETLKPEIMITHDCPDTIKYSMFPSYPLIKSKTGLFLAECLKVHVPKLWFFGHWHKSKSFKYTKDDSSCKFRCININEHLKVNLI